MKPSPMRRTLLASLALAPAWSSLARAQAWPERDVRIIAPVPPGGVVDLSVRALAEGLRQSLGYPVVVDNRAGAAGLVGTKAAAQAQADGYTLLYLHSGLVTVQAMNPRLDLLKELKMVARLTKSPFGMAVRADSPYKTAQDLIAAVRANPGKLTYGTGGIGSPAHLAVELIEERAGNFKALHVPFKAAVETVNAMLAGQIDFTVSVLGTLVPQVQTGRLRLLGVTSRERLATLPNTPTLAESGLSGFSFESWGGLAAPVGTPDSVIARLMQVLPGVMNTPAVKELSQRSGSVIEVVDGPTLAAQIARDLPVEQALVKRLDMKPDQ